MNGQRTFFFCVLLLAGALHAQAPKRYADGHGGQVLVPMGDLAFADSVVKFTAGSPSAIAEASVAENALHRPNFDGSTGGFLSLGCGGEVILKFTDNALVNIVGDDLYVFELGKYTEKTKLFIAKDTTHWIEVGELAGGRSSVDIGAVAGPGESFSYVKLVDLKTDCHGSWPGADIDAVAAIGSGRRVVLRAELLFDFNQAILKTNAKHTIDSLIASWPKDQRYRICVNGYTDSIGTATFNQQLSEQRAKAVTNYMKQQLRNKPMSYYSFGYGENFALTTNTSEEGRQRNRRVELILVPE